MVDVTGLGMSTDTEEEDNQEVLDNGADEEEMTDAEALLMVVMEATERYLEDADPQEVADFLEAASNAETLYFEVGIVAYADSEDSDGFPLEFEVEIELEPESAEEAIDDVEGSCDCGDSDER